MPDLATPGMGPRSEEKVKGRGDPCDLREVEGPPREDKERNGHSHMCRDTRSCVWKRFVAKKVAVPGRQTALDF